ncbi:Maf family protein [Actinokineospora globicatena]|uniref:Maf family protein n=1 Tax=Actinokineospora globicatena TaxID=103729 RepID=UPI0020A3E063|nr:nucleoside triphosphate pyrophosphatase [Actinokineospora globicatena]MCP2302058.1 septum formation protein [Actinokineospora globicatena]
MEFILASQSPARFGVLRAAGVDPVVRVSGVDEDAVAAGVVDPTPERVVGVLAEAKARTVVAAGDDAVVVGCDSMLHFDGELVGKPGTAERARERWGKLAGGTGVLLTGHAVLRVVGGEVVGSATGVEATTIRFSAPTQDEIDAYVASGEPLAVAGAFTIDGLGGWFVDSIEGNASSVVGISLPLTRRLLAEVGVSVTELWRSTT